MISGRNAARNPVVKCAKMITKICDDFLLKLMISSQERIRIVLRFVSECSRRIIADSFWDDMI